MSKKNKSTHKPSSREKLLATRSRVRKRRLLTALVGALILLSFLVADYLRDIPGEWYALTLWIFPLAWLLDSQYLRKIEADLRHH